MIAMTPAQLELIASGQLKLFPNTPADGDGDGKHPTHGKV